MTDIQVYGSLDNWIIHIATPAMRQVLIIE